MKSFAHSPCSVLVSIAAIAALAAPLAAQAMPTPAPELQKLEPLLGNWIGKGKMTEPGGAVSEWEGIGTYAKALDGHFVRVDFAIRFAALPTPLVMRGYLGWDRDARRYVNANVNSAGEITLNEVDLLPDGSMVELSIAQHPGMRFAQRSIFRVDGDAMVHTVDLLMPTGAMLAMVDGKFTRGGKGFAGDFATAPWMGAAPDAALTRLARSAGEYEVAGDMRLGAGQPTMKVTGTDTFRSVFGGLVFAGSTVGELAGVPGKYHGEVYWAHDPARGALTGVYLNNMGEVMQMTSRWVGGGQVVTTATKPFQGQAAVQRTVMDFDDAGAAKAAASHSIVGTGEPFEGWRATYRRK